MRSALSASESARFRAASSRLIVAFAAPSPRRWVLYLVTSADVRRAARWCPKNGVSRWIETVSRSADRRALAAYSCFSSSKTSGPDPI